MRLRGGRWELGERRPRVRHPTRKRHGDPGARSIRAIFLAQRLDAEEPMDLLAEHVLLAEPHRAPVDHLAQVLGTLDLTAQRLGGLEVTAA